MRERSNRAVSKTVVPFTGTVGSNPTLSALSNNAGCVPDEGAGLHRETLEGKRRRGEVSEWLKEHAWKACVVNATAGSNPALSADSHFLDEKQNGAVAQLGERYVRNVQAGSAPLVRLC